MRIDVHFSDRVGIAQEILAALAVRALNVTAVEVEPPHVYIEAPELDARDLDRLRSDLLAVSGVLAVGELEILPAHLPEELFMSDPAEDETAPRPAPQDAPPPGALPAAGGAFALASERPGARRLDQLEVELIERVMREVGGNLSAAARLLGVSRNRLYRKLGRTGSGGGDEG